MSKLIRRAILPVLALALTCWILRNVERAWTAKASNRCLANLRSIEGALSTWKIENPKAAEKFPDLQTLSPYFSNRVLICPEGGTYSIDPANGKPKCSIGGRDHSLTE